MKCNSKDKQQRKRKTRYVTLSFQKTCRTRGCSSKPTPSIVITVRNSKVATLFQSHNSYEKGGGIRSEYCTSCDFHSFCSCSQISSSKSDTQSIEHVAITLSSSPSVVGISEEGDNGFSVNSINHCRTTESRLRAEAGLQ